MEDLDAKPVKELLLLATTAFWTQDYEVAVTCASKVCQKLVEDLNDERHNTLGNVYLLYGKSLLKASGQQAAADREAARRGVRPTSSPSSERVQLEHGAEVNTPSNDIQLAWQVLEIAKEILAKRGPIGRVDYADCLLALGRVSLVSGRPDLAIIDIAAALELHKQLYAGSRDTRKLAETYSEFCNALRADNKLEMCVSNYNNMIELLETRLVVLSHFGSPGDTEVGELQVWVRKAREELADVHSIITNRDEPVASTSSAGDRSTTSGPAKRRHPDDDEEEGSSPAKRTN